MLIGELAFYGLVGAVAAVAFVGSALWTRRHTGARLRYTLVAPYVTGALALGYVGMSGEVLTLVAANGRPVPVSRFLVYLLTYTVVVGYVGLLADADRRTTLLGCGCIVGFVLATMLNWLFPAPVGTVGKAVTLVSIVGLLWILFRPLTRAAADVSGPRRLAFGKLRNLMALLILGYLVVGLTSRQGLGLLDAFTGVYVGGYLDVMGHLGFAAIVLRSADAMEELAADRASPLAYVRGGHSAVSGGSGDADIDIDTDPEGGD
ncbi:bacteriorhodopsin [Halorientalis marina]|uniref:bacteriorhodopsin n=1 Tax=Halorientalis marina TaxID=2931976 RepID=UPI001FF527C1|nr:bacteriorhodopsin [Halorientalis marina]